ncbi:MAG: SPASM domain-containing protein [Theionarchaea archaeon]|nr:SPASM domain-containing protein [Theionarchaea archaeon]
MEAVDAGGHLIIKDIDTLLLFNTIDSGLYRIESITEKLFILIKKHGIEAARDIIKQEDVNHVAEEKIEELKENGFLDPLPEITPPDTVPITGASLNVSHDCNLSCRYCYGGGGTYVGEKCYMDEPVGELSIDRLIEWSNGKKEVYVTFFGGEPLLNMKLIEHLVAYGDRKGDSEGKRIWYSITTNGTLLTEETVNFLNEHNFSVLVSMDGPQFIQDTNRPFKNGKGSFDVAVPQIRKLISTRKGNVTARATLTRDCMSLNTIIKGLRDVGFKYVHIEPVTAEKSRSFALCEKDFDKLKGEYKAVGRVFLDNILKGTPFGFSNIVRTINMIYNSTVRYYPCGAGKNMVAVDPHGGIYLCHRFTGMEEFSLGTIYDPDFSLQRKILHMPVDSREGCKDCWARHLCGGSCWQENYFYNNQIDEPYKPRCDLFKYIAALSMVIFSKIHEKDKELLDRMFEKNEPFYRKVDSREEVKNKKQRR